MILNDNKEYYNPLRTILPIIDSSLTTDKLDFIQSELFCGGILAESSEEFQELLNLLITLKKENYGKK